MRSTAISNPKSPSGRRSSRTPTSVLRTSEWAHPFAFGGKAGKNLDHRPPARDPGFMSRIKELRPWARKTTPPGMTRPRKLYVKSFGCQMNVYDSHRMADMLAPEGF